MEQSVSFWTPLQGRQRGDSSAENHQDNLRAVEKRQKLSFLV